MDLSACISANATGANNLIHQRLSDADYQWSAKSPDFATKVRDFGLL
jgi:hypothetical protein